MNCNVSFNKLLLCVYGGGGGLTGTPFIIFTTKVLKVMLCPIQSSDLNMTECLWKDMKGQKDLSQKPPRRICSLFSRKFRITYLLSSFMNSLQKVGNLCFLCFKGKRYMVTPNINVIETSTLFILFSSLFSNFDFWINDQWSGGHVSANLLMELILCVAD